MRILKSNLRDEKKNMFSFCKWYFLRMKQLQRNKALKLQAKKKNTKGCFFMMCVRMFDTSVKNQTENNDKMIKKGRKHREKFCNNGNVRGDLVSFFERNKKRKKWRFSCCVS